MEVQDIGHRDTNRFVATAIFVHGFSTRLKCESPTKELAGPHTIYLYFNSFQRT
jgi:hypothetical protein